MIFNLTNGLILLCSYLVGSVPFGLVITKAAGQGDVRKIGSGNIGATNVLRTGNKWLAVLTLLFDFFKGWCAVYFAKSMALKHGLPCSFVMGHMFPVWLVLRVGRALLPMLVC